MGGYWYVDSQPYSAVLDALIAASNSSQIVLTTGTYSDPGFIASLAASKITGTLAKSQQHAQTAYYDAAGTWTQAQTFPNNTIVGNSDGSNVLGGFTYFRPAAGGSSGGLISGTGAGWLSSLSIGSGLETTAPTNGLVVAGAATFNGTATINKTGSNGLIVNNTAGNALAIFNASAAGETDNAYLIIQTGGSPRWYVGQSVSSLTGDFEIYGAGFGGSMLTLNRTTGAITANAATFNGAITNTYAGAYSYLAEYGSFIGSKDSFGINELLVGRSVDDTAYLIGRHISLCYGDNANNVGLRITNTGATTFNGSVKLGIKTIATLPSAASSSGERYQVSDSATVANRIAFSNGSAWYYEGTAVAV